MALRFTNFPVILFLAFFWPGWGLAQPKSYYTKRLEATPPVIDGKDDDQAWLTVPWGGDFIQRDPYDGKPPTQKTTFKVLYDDDNIYALIRCYDTHPDSIVKRMTRRDEYEGDWVGISFDSYYDKLTAFSFMVTAAGVKLDETVTNDETFDMTFDPIWFEKTSIDAEGWMVEMRIPLSQLRFGKKELHTWGLQVIRNFYRKAEFSCWNPMPKKESGWVSRFGTLEGISGLHPKKDIELMPYLVARTEQTSKEEGNPFSKAIENKADVGLDGKISITNDLTLNFTINPDFGQVEADPSQVNLSAFETYYTEQRPFFVEGKNIYEFKPTEGDGGLSRDNLFYSRRLGRHPHRDPDVADDEYSKNPQQTHILGAFKLSGKTRKGLSIGILETLTAEEKADVGKIDDTRKETVEPLTNYFVTRLEQDFDKGKSIFGGMITATNRQLDDVMIKELTAAAYTGGLNFTRYFKNKTYSISLRTIFSHVEGSKEAITELQRSSARYFQRPDISYVKLDSNRTSLAGHGGTLSFSKMGGEHWQYMSWLTWRSPGLELNDIGYMHHADEIQHIIWAGYHISNPVFIFRNLNMNMNEYAGFDFGGTNLYVGCNINLNATLKNFWSIGMGANKDFAGMANSDLRGGPALKQPGGYSEWTYVSSDSRKKIILEANQSTYTGDEGFFKNQDYMIGITYKPANAVSLSLYPSYNKSQTILQYIDVVNFEGNDRYIMGTLLQESFSASFRLNYCISPDLSIQYWGQPFLFSGKYVDIKRITNSKAARFKDRFHVFTPSEIVKIPEEGDYSIDDNGDGNFDYTISDPDFSFFQFRSNLVLRWEFKPGSALFLVWSQGRTGDTSNGNFQFRQGMENLFDLHPDNTALVKLAYRFIF